MKDAFDVVADVISLIDVPAVRSLLTGSIHADNRPDGSKLIDVVVNCFGTTNNWQQKSTPNINIYVPNLPSGKKDSIKLRVIAKAVLPLVESQYRETFQTDVDNSGNSIQDPDGNWFYNIPVNYYSIQEKFKNV